MLRFGKMGIASLAIFGVLSVLLSAQTPQIDRLMPWSASPGDLVIIEGSNLSATTTVRFTFNFDVPQAPLVLTATPASVGATRVTFILPTVGVFTPQVPGGFFGGHIAFAELDVLGGTASNAAYLGFYESMGGVMTTVGGGGVQSTGQGAPVISWPSGPGGAGPQPGMPVYLQNAIPGSFAILAASAAAPAPYITLNGAPLVVQIAPVYVSALTPIDAVGFAIRYLPPIPQAVYNITAAVQWGVLDFAAQNVVLSNALLINL